jgi:cytidylate kinase
MYRVLTISREFGSGGSIVAQAVADRLGWQILDRTLVEDIAARASVDPALARECDERVDSWVHRIGRRALWSGTVEATASPVATADIFDSDTMASLGRSLIEEAYARGNCVIVGRGANCVLQRRNDVFHCFIYAPIAERVNRVMRRMSCSGDVADLIRSTDRRRAEFIRFHFGCDWTNPHLYDAMLNTTIGEDVVASVIVQVIEGSRSAA